MPSELMRKLKLAAESKPVQQTSASNVKIHVHACKVDQRLYQLNRETLYDMGLTGGDGCIEECAFIDTETTGLSGGAGTIAFLVGVGRIKDGLITVTQLLMPDYSAETMLLSELANLLEGAKTAVHFNGRRFDMPLIETRFTMKRMRESLPEMEQLDLLYPARKVWKLRLGCCRLSYIEEAIFGKPRHDDVPGKEIPELYFESIKRHDISLLDKVIEHNRQDILTLCDVLIRLHKAYEKPEIEREQLDVFSLGRTFEALGRHQVAKRLYTLAAKPKPVLTAADLKNELYAGHANQRLYLLERRAGEYRKCEETLKNMIKRRQLGLIPYIELAKLYEHKLKDYKSALEVTEKLLEYGETDELLHRKERLINKLNLK